MLIIPSCFHVSYDFINSWTGGSLCEVCEQAVLEVLPVERWSWMEHRRIRPTFRLRKPKKKKERVVVGMWGIPVFDWSLCGKHLESFCRWHYKAQHLVKKKKTEIKQVKQSQQVQCGSENLDLLDVWLSILTFACMYYLLITKSTAWATSLQTS